MRTLAITLLALAPFAALAAPYADDYDAYGGWRKLNGEKTGFFHTQRIEGRWWLVTPDGNAFFSKGVDNVSYGPEADSSPKAPDDLAAWAAMAAGQLRLWNFNTAGAWAASQIYTAGIAYAPVLNI